MTHEARPEGAVQRILVPPSDKFIKFCEERGVLPMSHGLPLSSEPFKEREVMEDLLRNWVSFGQQRPLLLDRAKELLGTGEIGEQDYMSFVLIAEQAAREEAEREAEKSRRFNL